MDSPVYKLEVFDGPLDLLLSLIEKHKIDIYDIKISLLLDQYMAYLDRCRVLDWEITADFIDMTARLMYIKSYSLLPKNEDSDEEDPKLELERMLQAYSEYKRLSEELKESYIGGSIFFRENYAEELPKTSGIALYDVSRLENAYRRILVKYSAAVPEKEDFGKIMSKGYVPVSDCIASVRKRIAGAGELKFDDVFTDCGSRSEIIGTFLAILELLRIGMIDISDRGSDIILFPSEEEV